MRTPLKEEWARPAWLLLPSPPLPTPASARDSRRAGAGRATWHHLIGSCPPAFHMGEKQARHTIPYPQETEVPQSIRGCSNTLTDHTPTEQGASDHGSLTAGLTPFARRSSACLKRAAIMTRTSRPCTTSQYVSVTIPHALAAWFIKVEPLRRGKRARTCSLTEPATTFTDSSMLDLDLRRSLTAGWWVGFGDQLS